MPKDTWRTFTDALKAAIKESDVPYLRIERETGVQRGSIARFMRGETSLRLDLADRLAEYFALEIRRKD